MWCIVEKPCTTTFCGRTGIHNIYLWCWLLETASVAWRTGLCSTVRDTLHSWSWGDFLSVVSTGQSTESSNGTMATSLRPCQCVRRDICPAHLKWLMSSATQRSSPFLETAWVDSHNPPGQIHLNHSTNTALIWRLFRGKCKADTDDGRKKDGSVCFIVAIDTSSVF